MGRKVYYYVIASFIDIRESIRKNKRALAFYSAAFLLGLVIGVFCGIKANDAELALLSTNSLVMYAIVRSEYIAYFFSTLTFVTIVFSVNIVFSKFSYSFIISLPFAVYIGIGLSQTVVLVFRFFGVAAIPFIIVYVLFQLAIAVLILIVLAFVFYMNSESRRFGCRFNLKQTAISLFPYYLLTIIILFAQMIVMLVFSFFL